MRERILAVYEPWLGTPRTLRVLRVIWGEGLRNPKITEPICRKFLLPVLEPQGLLSKFIEGEEIPEFLQKYPLALAAPLIQGVVLTTIAGNTLKVDLRAYLEAYLDFVLQSRRGGSVNRSTSGAPPPFGRRPPSPGRRPSSLRPDRA